MDISQKDNKRTEVYGHITDRIKKLTEALYRVTDLYSDKEPLKWGLRENAIYLYTNIMSILTYRSNRTYFQEILQCFSQIINMLEIASLGGFISDINFEILKREYQSLKYLIEGEKDIFLEKEMLMKPFISQIKDKGHNGHKIIKDKKLYRTLNKSTNERKQKILNFLRNNGKKNTKEITSIFRDISEKTVQRDLLDLVKSGLLSTEGEKRWRVYFLSEKPKREEI